LYIVDAPKNEPVFLAYKNEGHDDAGDDVSKSFTIHSPLQCK
jgi:hypothetical protein